MSDRDVTTAEIWKPIPSFPGYEASSLGRIKSIDRTIVIADGSRRFLRGRMIAPWKVKTGYPMVYCKGAGRYVHALVIEAFHGPRPKGCQCCHNDGNRENPRADNLRYATRHENEQDKRRHGTYYGRGGANLCANSVVRIKRLLAEGRLTQKVVAQEFHVTRSAIGHIKAGRSWPHVA